VANFRSVQENDAARTESECARMACAHAGEGTPGDAQREAHTLGNSDSSLASVQALLPCLQKSRSAFGLQGVAKALPCAGQHNAADYAHMAGAYNSLRGSPQMCSRTPVHHTASPA